MIELAAITAAAALVDPLLTPQRRAVLSEAVQRARRGNARVLVLGEAKRGKSTLVNALFSAPLLPTGALPLTSVATVVVVGPRSSCEVRYEDGRVEQAGLDELGGLVSQRGNPGNERGVDRVLVTAPCLTLPEGTEVVDTPGTGSVHSANTDEAERARSALDVAVLVVAADPPVSAVELELLVDALSTASRAAVVVNKADLLAEGELAEVVEFTARVVADRAGATVSVFPLSALTERRRYGGFEVFTSWLGEQLSSHGAADALASTARALRREATGLRDAAMVQTQLLRRRDERGGATLVALGEILDRADERAQAAVDHLHGEAKRLREQLDEAHDNAVAGALTASARVLQEVASRQDGLSPEELVERVRSTVADATRTRARDWYRDTGGELAAGMRRATGLACESLRGELTRARHAAGELLQVELSVVADLAVPEAPRTPSFEASVHPGWEELVSAAVRRRLPASMRRRQGLRELQRWRVLAVPRPFGRGRSTLQDNLRELTRAAERFIEGTRIEHVATLRQGVAAVRQDRSESQVMAELAGLAQRGSELDKVLSLLHRGLG